jgi:hypothetical protein
MCRQLLSQSTQPCHLVLGVREVATTQAAYHGLEFDQSLHKCTFLPLDLSNLRAVAGFAEQALSTLGSTSFDYLFLCAAISEPAGSTGTTGPNGSKWSKTFMVNHLCTSLYAS